MATWKVSVTDVWRYQRGDYRGIVIDTPQSIGVVFFGNNVVFSITAKDFQTVKDEIKYYVDLKSEVA